MSARKKSTPAPVLALDLGTTSLRAALIVDGQPQVVAFPGEGGRIPTIVGFDGDQLVLGDLSRRLAITEPLTQVFASLRLAGRRHELSGLDASEFVERGPGGDVQFVFPTSAASGSTSWPIPRLLGALIQSLVDRVQRRARIRIERAVVSIAPSSDDARRRAILHALDIAGLGEAELVHGTTAIAIAWSTLQRLDGVALGLTQLDAALARPKPELDLDDPDEDSDSDSDDDDDDDGDSEAELDEADTEDEDAEPEPEPSEQRILILDLGAGSFDAALARLDGPHVEILATRSRSDLGGEDIDARIVEWLLGQFEDANEVDLSGDPTVRARMRDVAEKAKIALSDVEVHEIRLPFLWADEVGPKHLFVTLERERFERLIRDLIEDTAALAKATLAEVGQDPDELDAIVMVGGCARIPVLQDRVESLFGRVPETELATRALDEDFLVRGLALEAHRRSYRRKPWRVAEIASRELWLRADVPVDAKDRSRPHRLLEAGTPTPLSRKLDVELDDAGQATLELLEDEHRSLGLRATIEGEPGAKIRVHVGLDQDGRIDVRADPPATGLRLRERVGLSERALLRLRREAKDRALDAALRARSERLRTRVQTLGRTVQSWLSDANSGLDELLRPSLGSWARETEAALETAAVGDDEPLLAALESFASLRDALPGKLREQLEDEPLGSTDAPGSLGEGDGASEVDEPELGEPCEDYGADDRVAVLEMRRADDDDDEPEASDEPDDDDDPEPEAGDEPDDDDDPEPETSAGPDEDDDPEPEASDEPGSKLEVELEDAAEASKSETTSGDGSESAAE